MYLLPCNLSFDYKAGTFTPLHGGYLKGPHRILSEAFSCGFSNSWYGWLLSLLHLYLAWNGYLRPPPWWLWTMLFHVIFSGCWDCLWVATFAVVPCASSPKTDCCVTGKGISIKNVVLFHSVCMFCLWGRISLCCACLALLCRWFVVCLGSMTAAASRLPLPMPGPSAVLSVHCAAPVLPHFMGYPSLFRELSRSWAAKCIIMYAHYEFVSD